MASITSPMAPAKSAIAEFDQAAPGQYRLLGRLPVQGHGIGDVEADGLRYAPGLRGEPRRGKAMLARESVERGLEHITAGGAAHAGVEPQCGLLLDRLPARFGVTLIKLALQESLEVRHLELFDHVPVARHDTTDAG